MDINLRDNAILNALYHLTRKMQAADAGIWDWEKLFNSTSLEARSAIERISFANGIAVRGQLLY